MEMHFWQHTGKESNMIREELKKKLESEALRIEQDSELTAKAQFHEAEFWNFLQHTIIISATILSTVAFFLSTKDYGFLGIIPVFGRTILIAKVINIFSTFITGILTTLIATINPAEKIRLHQNSGTSLLKLYNDTRIFRNIHLLREDVSEEELCKAMHILSDRRSNLRDKSPQHSSKAYKKAIKSKKEVSSVAC